MSEGQGVCSLWHLTWNNAHDTQATEARQGNWVAQPDPGERGLRKPSCRVLSGSASVTCDYRWRMGLQSKAGFTLGFIDF